MDEKLDFNKLLRRDGANQQKEKAMPSELFQCVIFYSRKVTDEIEQFKELKPIAEMKFNTFIGKLQYGDIKEITKRILEEVDNQRFIFPFYSKEIFMSQQEAQNFLPVFIKRLIKEEKLPQNVINEDTSVNDDLIKLGIAPLTVSILEQDKPEFKGIT